MVGHLGSSNHILITTCVHCHGKIAAGVWVLEEDMSGILAWVIKTEWDVQIGAQLDENNTHIFGKQNL